MRFFKHSAPKSLDTVESLWRLEKLILNSLDFNHVVQEIVDAVLHELGYLKLGYEIMVLTLINKKTDTLERISISKTNKAKLALEKSPIPFHKIKIPLDDQHNLLIKAIKAKTPLTTRDWREILTPAFSQEEASIIQQDLGIKSSLIYPVYSQTEVTGALILSMSKQPSQVTEAERDLVRSFADIVGLAVQNASLYSQLGEANDQLKAANKNLKHLDKLKDEFVFVATHELKTPVTVMKGYLSLIYTGEYGPVPEKIGQAFKEIQSANTQLVNLVNDLLQIARAEAKTITIDTKPTDVKQVIEADLQNLQTLASQKHLELKYTPPAKLSKIQADPTKIQEILNNLVSNAIKYSDKGTITISHDQDQEGLTTHVADQGIGIGAEDQKKLFTRFFRAEETEGTPGTGLGLFIVKQLVERMGGKIWFESEEGQGTTFSFFLPLSKSK